MNIRPWAVEIYYPPTKLDQYLPDDVQLRFHRVVKKFWFKRNALRYRDYLLKLRRVHTSSAYRNQYKNCTYYVTRTK